MSVLILVIVVELIVLQIALRCIYKSKCYFSSVVHWCATARTKGMGLFQIYRDEKNRRTNSPPLFYRYLMIVDAIYDSVSGWMLCTKPFQTPLLAWFSWFNKSVLRSHSDSTPLIIASAMLRYEHSRKLVPQVPASLWYGSSTLACTEDAYVYIRRKTHVAIVSSALVFVNMLFFLCRHSDVRYSYGAVRYIPEPGHTEYSFRLLTYIHH